MIENTATAPLLGKTMSLGYYVDKIRGGRPSKKNPSDTVFFSTIALRIVPLIRQSPYFATIYLKYVKERDGYKKRVAYLEGQIPAEIEQAFRSLKNDLLSANVLCADGILAQQIYDIDQVFCEKERYGIPSYVGVAHERLCVVLRYLFDLGQNIHIVKKYANIVQHKINVYNADLKERIDIERPYLEECTFAPLYAEKERLDNLWIGKEIPVWMGWEYLVLVEWCWNTAEDFFKEKTLSYSDYQSTVSSVELLILHEHWLEINKLKHGGDSNSVFFTQDSFMALVDQVVEDIIFDQNVNPADWSGAQADKESHTPYSATLRFDGLNSCLCVDVEWHEGIEIESYTITTFQMGLGPYNFFEALLKNIGERVDIKKVSGTDSGTVPKYFEGLKIIRALFCSSKGNENRVTTCATLKAQTIYGKTLSEDEREALKQFLLQKSSRIPSVERIFQIK